MDDAPSVQELDAPAASQELEEFEVELGAGDELRLGAVTLSVTRVRGRSAVFGVRAPPEVRIVRGEISSRPTMRERVLGIIRKQRNSSMVDGDDPRVFVKRRRKIC